MRTLRWPYKLIAFISSTLSRKRIPALSADSSLDPGCSGGLFGAFLRGCR